MSFFTKSLPLIAAACALIAGSAFALDLHSARVGGLVAEKPSGYIEAVKPSSEVNSLVAEVNAKRKAEYERIAKEKGTSADAVAALAAQEISRQGK